MTGYNEQVRDALIASAPEHEDMIMSRDAIVRKWCEENDADINSLSIEQILTIRALPEWIAAGS